MPYLDTAAFKTRTLAEGGIIDAIEAVDPGWTQIQLDEIGAWIESRLRKRYATPFAEPFPIQVLSWQARMMTVRCYLKRGVSPTDEQFQSIQQDATDAKAEILDAANGDAGLFDLPLRSDTTATGISKGGPWAYSEQSPYVGFSQQARTGRQEDSNGGGAYG